jgi:hypothetical protein
MTTITSRQLKGLFIRKATGEKASLLAQECGVTTQKLMGLFKAAGLNETTDLVALNREEVAELEAEMRAAAKVEPAVEETKGDDFCHNCGEVAVLDEAGLCGPCKAEYESCPSLPEETVGDEVVAQELAAQEEADEDAAYQQWLASHQPAPAKPAKAAPVQVAPELVAALYQRHLAGEKLAPLAKEAGVSWNKLWVYFDAMKKAAK